MAGAEMGELEVTEVEGTVAQVPVPLSTLDARAAVLEDPGLQLLGEIFRKNGHELRLAGGVVSCDLFNVFRWLISSTLLSF